MAKFKILITESDGTKTTGEVNGAKFKFEGFDFFYHNKPDSEGAFKVSHLQSGQIAARFTRSELAACLKDKKAAAELALSGRIKIFGMETFVKVMKNAPSI